MTIDAYVPSSYVETTYDIFHEIRLALNGYRDAYMNATIYSIGVSHKMFGYETRDGRFFLHPAYLQPVTPAKDEPDDRTTNPH